MNNEQVLQKILNKVANVSINQFGSALSDDTLRVMALELGFIESRKRAGTFATPLGLDYIDMTQEEYVKIQAEDKANNFKTRELARLEKRLAELRGVDTSVPPSVESTVNTSAVNA